MRAYYTDGDPYLLSSELNAAVASRWSGGMESSTSAPAVTLVPVTGMKVAHADSPVAGEPKLAMQVLAVDSVHMETEMWINYGRSYD